ncbi:hypothetical protein HRI_001346900 [Hibiscus trionum]|uniref:FCP1 homology domain-containing protein n=1 Tax=Hibiscus trionum TaxID=183268 RepID=A0A9W7LUY2_HIBTR|nr:hypothetical protein HRI_001346900 [Hibiscus trionum]
MEKLKNVADSSVSDVKSTRSDKKKPKKQRTEPDIESGNAEKETCLREDVVLGTEQSSGSRRKKKRKGSSSIDEKQSDSFVVSEACSLMKDALSGRDSSVRTPDCPLHEQSALSETKRKSKMAKSGELENLSAESVLELKDGEENSLMNEKKVSDSHLESKMSVSLESGLKKKGESSGLGILENCSLESPLKEGQMNEQSTPSDTKQKRKKKKSKGSIFGEFDKLNGESILELNDKEGKPLKDEKKASSSHLESKTKIFSLESGLEGAQLNEQSERKRKKGKGKKTRLLSIVEGEDVSAKNNGKDSNETENNNMHSEPINGKDSRTDDLTSISEAVESQNMKKVVLITDKQSVSQIIASTGLVETQNSHVDGDRETFEIGKKAKTHHKKRKKSSNLSGDGSELIQTSVYHLDKEHTTGLENGSVGVPVGQAMPVQVSEVASGNSISTESDLKERKRKKQKKSKESLGNNEEIETKAEEFIPSPSNLAVTKGDVTLTAKVSEVALGDSTGTESDLKGRKRKKRKKLKESLCKDEDQKDVETETKMEKVIPSPLNLAVTKDNVTLTTNASPLNLDVATVDVTLTAKVSEVALGNSTGTESDPEGSKRKKQKKSKKSLCKDEDQKDIETESKMEKVIPSSLNLAVAKDNVTPTSNVSPSNLAVAKDDATLRANVKENNFSRTLHTSFQRNCIIRPKKKLLVLDLNGILVDVVQIPCKIKPHARVNGKGVFRRPFYEEFLDFCFRTFNVGIWSSRVHKNVIGVLDLLMDRKRRRELVFCYGRKLCTITEFKTLENEDKPLVLKELRKLWDKKLPNIPWKKGEYDESNTFLLDDSPYKALRNPANTAIFPYPYQYTDAADCSLAPGGDLRTYLERLAEADNVQKFIEQNPFGQPAITEADPHWDFYSQIIEAKTLQAR